MRLGRMTALSKDDGGVRGIVAGDVIRRLTARTMAQQLSKAMESSTAPFQFALSTKAGCECIPHTLQTLCEMNPEATVISVDGSVHSISCPDVPCWKVFILSLAGQKRLPFVRMFYGQPSRYLWEDNSGTVHTIHQGEGGEQGDVFMPLLFSLGQHGALAAVQRQLHASEKMFAYLDDIYIVTTPARVGHVYSLLQDALFRHARIRLHSGKTQVWNSGGIRPEACDALERVARAVNPRPWCGRVQMCYLASRGSKSSEHRWSILTLSLPTSKEPLQNTKFFAGPDPPRSDVQSAWLILLHCAGARANYLIRMVSLDQVRGFAESHDSRLWACLCQILQIPPNSCDHSSRGCGLRSATRTSQRCLLACWADCLHMGHQRHAPLLNCSSVSWRVAPTLPT